MGALTKFASFNSTIEETGIIPLDIVLGGGYCRGDLHEVASKSGVGKSTLMLNLMKNELAKGKMCAYVDVEKGVKKSICDNMGLPEPSCEPGSPFLLLSPTTFRDAEEILGMVLDLDEKQMKKGMKPYDHIFVDSITALIPSKMREKSIEEPEPGIKARMQSAFMEKYKPCLRETGACMWMINQMRMHLDFAPGGEGCVEKSAGSRALEFYPDIRLRMQAGPVLKREEQTVMGIKDVIYGNMARIWAVKNRGERPEIRVTIPILFGLGVSNVLLLKEIITEQKIVTGGAGGFFTINWKGGEVSVRGTDELTGWIRANMGELKEYLKAQGHFDLTKGVDQ